jgi:iron complex transport system substrate-binding protein
VPRAGGAVSVSLCADGYLLALAGPGRISALSWQAGDPVSAAPDWAGGLPQAWPDAERLYALAPGLTVFAAGEGGRTARLLERAGLEAFELAWVSDFEGIRSNLRALGAALGEPERAASAIADLDARLAVLAQRAARRGARPRVLYLSASGGTAGAGTFIDAAIAAAGGVNVMAGAGVRGWPRSSPETLLQVDSDILVTSFFRDGYSGRFNRGVHNAAYRHVLDHPRRIEVPAGDWPCAGPRLIEAAERIADALDAWADAS